MNGDFENFIKTLESYEDDFITLWKEYNPKDSCLKMELLAMKLSVIYYKYSIACFEMLDDITKEKYLSIAKSWLTFISYALTGVTIIKAPDITIPSLLGSVYLSLKNRQNKRFKQPLTPEQQDEVLDLLDRFEDDYYSQIESIFERIDVLEDEQVLEDLEEPEKSKRKACKKLMQFLRKESPTIYMESDDFIANLTDIIQDGLNTDTNDMFELLQESANSYESLNRTLTKLDQKEYKLSRFYKMTNI